jgi:STE24 endopeptidase
MYNTIFYVIVAILVFNFILERFLSYLNTTRWSAELPEELKGVYDDEKYRKHQQYKRENNRFAWVTSTFSFILIMAMLFFEGFALIDSWARSLADDPLLVTLIFFGILMLASDILNTPFSLYATFVIEEKYGFNKTTPKTFVLDKLKGWLLGILIGGILMTVIVKLYLATGPQFWVYAWIIVSVFSIFMSMFYTTLIVPIFNKLTPLEDGGLKNEIEKMAVRTHFKLTDVFVMDGSKRSTKANAFFSGLGPKKRIVLYDTLINDLESDEVVAVLAHEIGHYKLKHTLLSIVLSVVQTGISFYILSLLIDNPALSQALGAEQPGFHLGLIAFGILYSPITTILGLAMNMMSRKNEYQADAFANQHHNGEALISSLKKLSSNSLSNLTPHPLYVFFHYSHPTLLQRIRAIRK